jgi:phosphonate transport system permease protein
MAARASTGATGAAGAAGAALGALALLAFVTASFRSLDLHVSTLISADALAAMGHFVAEFFPLESSPGFLRKLGAATLETLAMSALGTLLATAAAAALCLPAAGAAPGAAAIARWGVRAVLGALRAVPELVWAALLLVAAGLGPMAGTLALALHTTGVLGRLFAEAIENTPCGPAQSLRALGASEPQVLLFATLPQAAPQLLSYVLYRWENNIRAAAVLGVVGAGGLGQMLAFHLALFQMRQTASVIAATLVLVAAVEWASHLARRALVRAR